MDLHELLDERERRWHARLDIARTRQCAVLSLTLNIPGPDKNLPGVEAAFARLREDLLRALEIGGGRDVLLAQQALSGLDGPCWLAAVGMDARELKALAVAFEDSHPLGRLADADVLDAEGCPVNRNAVGHRPRRCFLCGQAASLCRREGRHSQRAVLDCVRALLKENTAEDTASSSMQATAATRHEEALPYGSS